MMPKNADAFVHNQIFIKAPASVIWSNLVKAKDWPKWYSNSSDIKITDGSELGPKPRAMYDAHDWWLSALKVRSENVVKD